MFLANRKPEREGRQIGAIVILTSIVTSLAPVIGGFVATRFGIHYTLVLAMAIMIFAPYPLFQTKENFPEHKLDL